MTIKIHPIPAFSDNYIWILHDDIHAVAVDPGDSRAVEDYLSAHQLTLDTILITHHHYDHVDGLVTLQNNWNCAVFAPNDDRIPGKLTTVQSHDTVNIDVLGLRFQVLFTPGHTLSHICYHDHDKLFCGDTLFSLGCGRMFEGTPEQFINSLEQLKNLNEQTQVYCTHEYTASNWQFAHKVSPNDTQLKQFKDQLDLKRANNQPSLPSSLAIEKRHNPFLNCDKDTIISAIEQEFSIKPQTLTESFALLRRWKDSF